jgi:hypothetical protein
MYQYLRELNGGSLRCKESSFIQRRRRKAFFFFIIIYNRRV